MIGVLVPNVRPYSRHGQKGVLLEQHDLLPIRHSLQIFQPIFHNIEIRYEAIDDPTPCFVESLVPYASGVDAEARFEDATFSEDCNRSAVQHSFTVFSGYQIHFVNQGEDARSWRICTKSGNDGGIGLQVAIGASVSAVCREIGRFDIEYINQHSNIAEDIGLLRRQIAFGEGVLSILHVSACKQTHQLY